LKVDFNKLNRAFDPRCVVVVGDKRESDFMWLRAQSNFKGKLYSVQIAPEEIEAIEALGVKNYTSLMDITEPVDLAIIAVPRGVTPRVLEDCIKKDVAGAIFYTAGFSETETEEGIKLERLLARRAEDQTKPVPVWRWRWTCRVHLAQWCAGPFILSRGKPAGRGYQQIGELRQWHCSRLPGIS
jgi:acetyltransferase